jgi:hypothetical protein
VNELFGKCPEESHDSSVKTVGKSGFGKEHEGTESGDTENLSDLKGAE